jgi:hypothetical protein
VTNVGSESSGYQERLGELGCGFLPKTDLWTQLNLVAKRYNRHAISAQKQGMMLEVTYKVEQRPSGQN